MNDVHPILPAKLMVFIRHGIAEDPAQFPGDDKDRPLTGKGRRRTARMASGLLDLYAPNLVVTSDLLRSIETADVIEATAKRHGIAAPRRLATAALGPDAEWSDWLGFLNESVGRDIEPGSVIFVVGHEPSISKLFARQLGVDDLHAPFKKAGVGVVEPISYESGKLIAFIPPKFFA